VKLLVALAMWVGALGMVLAFAQDERPVRSATRLERIRPDERRPRPPTFERRGESQSCVASTRNAVSIDLCVSPTTVRVGEPVTVEVRSVDFGRDCGEIALDFGDGTAGPARTTDHRYNRPGAYTIRVLGGTCASDVRLRVTVRP
jgi:hypothetical protein